MAIAHTINQWDQVDCHTQILGACYYGYQGYWNKIYGDFVFVNILSVCISIRNYHVIFCCNQNACIKLIKIVEDHDYFPMVLTPLKNGVGKARTNVELLYIFVYFLSLTLSPLIFQHSLLWLLR